MTKSDFKDCDAYAARIAALRPFPSETLKSLRDYYRVGLTYTSNALDGNSLTESETKVVIEDGLTIGGKLLRLMGESIALSSDGINVENDDGINEGIKTLCEIIAQNPGRRTTDLAGLLGKSVPTVERYVKALKDRGEVEFRGSKKTGGYWRGK